MGYLDACYLIQDFILDIEDDEFHSDEKTQSAVIYKMMVIGEITKRLSQATKDTYSHIPWKKMVGMRNALAHDYDELKLEIIWQTAKEEIPQLMIHIKAILPNENE